ncbi:hypothetical protein GOBAR_DD18830 [Gossypium barbadense]|nr:hypothetical protein GOBAR_DD18830 [Gossypium barbadense]
MAMRELYGDWDALYNEFQGWIVEMREYVLGTVNDLKILSYKGPDEEIQSGNEFFTDCFGHSSCVLRYSLTVSRWCRWTVPGCIINTHVQPNFAHYPNQCPPKPTQTQQT